VQTFRDLLGRNPVKTVEAAKQLSTQRETSARLAVLLEWERRPHVRQAILHALAWHGRRSLGALFVRILRDEAEAAGVRGQAAEALENLSSSSRRRARC
jgi:hypothetical protein